MDELKDIVKEVAGIWRMHKRQEALFRAAMALDTTRPLRVICGSCYMTSLLFQSEMRQLYESLKCCLTDGDLSSILLLDDEAGNSDADCWMVISRCLEHDELLIRMYQSLLAKVDEESECWRMCHEHLEKLTGCHDKLAAESRDLIMEHSSHASVA
ncbi:hypothetical protein [Dyadobacter sandarakinus]|uniref:Ferritin-like metal-binding protein YciE n=1 Tax=Dyadobacter sandarakinus TaxID=2747268 RepID=A0ABX7I3E9_9BACT|nr:hypothetical protein [Dyadobacter sandarakinus]QRR00325.1 hypothetical protein HWI92_05090 [Dyadobacter sandarakinus]